MADSFCSESETETLCCRRHFVLPLNSKVSPPAPNLCPVLKNHRHQNLDLMDLMDLMDLNGFIQ
ncbi:Hypothetical predicted protein [Xyrichtys novacula]|uniref:Uncharacterized protein n=1 Tax=Xyrichtys novacula TaxID=13765 RepID=A0AAV1FF49_XYRNO|nr:Hypothetical predicted protein [Xyrichtys novacula]